MCNILFILKDQIGFAAHMLGCLEKCFRVLPNGLPVQIGQQVLKSSNHSKTYEFARVSYTKVLSEQTKDYVGNIKA